ncbi:hypothetical protein KM043_008383 [Ampulex compressa]|nr:hypothetical protein KM043_008383 [Ampulex compressa]
MKKSAWPPLRRRETLAPGARNKKKGSTFRKESFNQTPPSQYQYSASIASGNDLSLPNKRNEIQEKRNERLPSESITVPEGSEAIITESLNTQCQATGSLSRVPVAGLFHKRG